MLLTHAYSLDTWQCSSRQVVFYVLGITLKIENLKEHYRNLMRFNFLKKVRKRRKTTGRYTLCTERILLRSVPARSCFQDFERWIFRFKMHLTLSGRLTATPTKWKSTSTPTPIMRLQWSQIFAKYTNRVLKIIGIILVCLPKWMKLTLHNELPPSIRYRIVTKTTFFFFF